MKIVFFRHSLLNRGGDKMIAAHASFLAAQGHQVIIAANRFDTVHLIHPLVRLVPLKLPGKIGTILSAAVTTYRDTLVIADIIPMACLLSFCNHGRIAYFAQDNDESYYSSSAMRLLIRILYHLGLGRLKIPTIAVSKNLADELGKPYDAVITVVPNGVDASMFYPEPNPDYIASKAGRKAVLLFSRSDWRKGFDIAVKTMSKVAIDSDFKDTLEVWTVGEAATGRFEGLPHKDFGYVDEVELRRIMSSADLFLYPSRHEGLPLMPLEAMACGCPVVCSSASAAVAENGYNALVVDNGNDTGFAASVMRILNDGPLRESFINNGRTTALEMSLDGATRKFEDSVLRLYDRESTV